MAATNIERSGGVTIALAGMVALAVPMGIGRFALTPILPMMQLNAGVSIADGGWLPVMARAVADDPAVFGWAWPIFGAAAAVSTFVMSAVAGSIDHRRLWSVGYVILAAGVVLPVISPGLGAIIASALLVGAMFTCITMAGFSEARAVRGAAARGLIGALASAFAVGQIVALVGVSVAARAGRGFHDALVVSAVLLVASAAALLVGERSGPA